MSHLALQDETPFRFCKVPDHVGTDRLCKWPDPDIGWSMADSSVPGFTEDEFIETAFKVFETLRNACGIRPKMTQLRNARIVLDVRAIDGPNGVLAESELPCGNPKQCHQWYDVGEKWLKTGSRERGIFLYLVMLHELMHALGVGHAPQGVKAVIAPFYDADLIDLMPYDIEQLQTRYGPPFKPVPPVVPTPIPQPKPNDPNAGGGIMGKLLPLLTLLAQLGPVLKVIVDLVNSGQLNKIMDVLKTFSDLLGALPTSAMKTKQAEVSKDDLKARLKEAIGIAKLLAAWTPTQADDDLVKSLEQVFLTDWVLELLLRASSYKSDYVEQSAIQATNAHLTTV